MTERMFSQDEAWGLLELVKNSLLHAPIELSRGEVRGLGRLLSEIHYSLSSDTESQERIRPVS